MKWISPVLHKVVGWGSKARCARPVLVQTVVFLGDFVGIVGYYGFREKGMKSRMSFFTCEKQRACGHHCTDNPPQPSPSPAPIL